MTVAKLLAPQISLRIGGNPVSRDVWRNVLSVEVDDSLFLPDMFAIRLRDYPIKWLDDDSFAVGGSVEVSSMVGSDVVCLVSGEITAIEFNAQRNGGATLTLRGYDRSHRLNRDRVTRSFVQMSDADIVEAIAKDAHLKTNVDDTRQIYDHVLQDNLTDWEFLCQRGSRIGYRVFVEADTLHFVKAPADEKDQPTLMWGLNLQEFSARMSTAMQVSEVIVQGWNPDTQQQLVGKATVPDDVPAIGEKRLGGQVAEEAFGITAKRVVVNRPVATQSEAETLAQASCNELGQEFLQAEGVCIGNPYVQAGATVRIEGVGKRLTGTYRVTHALHRYHHDGYTTEFTLGGRHTSILSELLRLSRRSGGGGQSPMLGVVTNNDDQEHPGQVKVTFPTLSGSHESAWARLVAPGAGNERGLVWVPDVHDEVLVVFEHGDINRPLVIGGLWSRKSPPADSSNLVGKDENGKSVGIAVHIDTHHKMGLKITDKFDDTSLTLGDADNHLAISATGKEVKVTSADKIVLESKKGSGMAILGQDGEIEITNGQGGIKITRSSIEIANGKGASIMLEGPKVSVNGSALEVT